MTDITNVNGDTVALAQLKHDIEEGITANEAKVRAAALDRVRKQKGLIARLLPSSAVEKALDAGDAAEIEKVAEHRVALLDIHAAAMQKRTQQEAEAVLRANGMHLVTELTSFAFFCLDQLARDKAAAREKVADRVIEQVGKLGDYASVPWLYDQLDAEIRKDQADYFTVMDDLHAMFREALTTRINQTKAIQ